MNKKKLKIIAALILVLVFAVSCVNNSENSTSQNTTLSTTSSKVDNTTTNPEDDSAYPWDNGGKQPNEYTWEEFITLAPNLQVAFQNSFVSTEEFEAWLQKVQLTADNNPWDKEGAKQPSEYTWAEFEELTGRQQMAFQNSFESIEAFEEWMNRAQNGTVKYPWEESGAKQPSEYTWNEFISLTPSEQVAFQNAFESETAFDEWLDNVQKQNNPYPWDEEGAKPQAEYTWAEFEALSPELQIAFQNTIEDFETWFEENYPG